MGQCVSVEAYRGSLEETNELFHIYRHNVENWTDPSWSCARVFMMIYKKGSRDDLPNYHAIYLLCHSYKLLSAVIARRLMEVLDDHLPDTQAGFRPARGRWDNVCALRWFIAMVLREGRNAVTTFIDYRAAFKTESQLFLDSALADAGVSAKVRRIIQAVFTTATGIVCVRLPSGVNVMSECSQETSSHLSRSSLAWTSSSGRTMLPTPGW